ncbi:MAG: Crp/Fnr family transcriptional regulator [Aquabacterium sp.]|nr:Crp/Fnr family transcriptional regulator [Aquabacterium sp.]
MPYPKMTTALSYLPVVRRGAWFASLPASTAELLLSRMTVRHLRARELLFERGAPFDGLYCVVRGVLKLSNIHADGRESIMGLTEASQWFGEISLFDRQPRSVDGTAEDSCTVLHLPRAETDQLLREHPGLALHFGVLLAQKMRTALLALDAMAHLPRNARMARYLVMLATQQWSVLPECTRTTVPFQQEQIALLMLVTRQTVGLALKDLEAMSIIRRHYGHIDILDWDRLNQVAELPSALDIHPSSAHVPATVLSFQAA